MFLRKKRKKTAQKPKKKAITFIEVAIVIAILAILIAGVLTASKVIHKSKLATAQNLTINAPVNGTNGLYAWFEPTSQNSLYESENEEGAALSFWKNIKVGNNAMNANQSDSLHQPTFSGEINDLTTVNFDGTGKYFEIDATYLNNSDYSIIVVEKRKSGNDDNYFIGDSSITNENENILLGYSSTGQVIHSQGGDNSYHSSVSSYTESNNDSRIFTFIQNSSTGKSTYINGYLAGQDADNTKIDNLSNLTIGKDYHGDIGEIIIFDKALTNRERQNIEGYLSQKWAIHVTNDEMSCTNGIVTAEGCHIACSVNVNGVSTPTTVAGGTSVTLSCNAPGYDSSDTVDYTCSITGNESISGECDTCSSGFSYYLGTCQSGCDPTSYIAGTTTTSVNAGTGSVTCNDTANNFDGSSTVSYSCSNGVLTPDDGQKCSCITNYELNESGTACVLGCTGGARSDITVSGVKYRVHTFITTTSNKTFKCPSARNVEVLVVGAGGSAKSSSSDKPTAGGGGGVVHNTNFAITSDPITVTVGDGQDNNNGLPSSFSTITAYGGAVGGTNAGSSGGSAGGSRTSTVYTSSSGQGSNGGSGCTYPTDSKYFSSGGGGGAGKEGSNGTCTTSTVNFVPGKGGDGVQIDITGTPTYYGGGGGGVANNQFSGTVNAAGGLGGGGSGGNGINNTGGGAGGGSDDNSRGGSGIVIVRYVIP